MVKTPNGVVRVPGGARGNPQSTMFQEGSDQVVAIVPACRAAELDEGGRGCTDCISQAVAFTSVLTTATCPSTPSRRAVFLSAVSLQLPAHGMCDEHTLSEKVNDQTCHACLLLFAACGKKRAIDMQLVCVFIHSSLTLS